MKTGLLIFFNLLFFCANTSEVLAQTCEGNLGENIFTEGDFGSGSANILLPNPLIAPGYGYTTNPPPWDGQYTVTNNTGEWFDLYPTWLEIEDNSSDPDGYMMVVNASYQPGLFYELEVDGLCENTLYEFSADVINLIQNGVAAHIRPSVSFLIDDVQVYTTGDIAQDEQWNTYGFTFVTNSSQTSVKLSLRNNAPGGIGNDLALDNITFRPCGPEALILPFEIANICEDEDPIELNATIIGDQYDTAAFQWQQSFDEGVTWVDIPGENGSSYTHTNLIGGFYYYRYLVAGDPSNLSNSKCRIVSNIKIVNVVPKLYEIIDTLCEGLSYFVGNSIYSVSGIYVDSLISLFGCDSIVTLDLTIFPDAQIDAIILKDDPRCSDSEDGMITIEAVINGTAPLSYFLNNELFLNGFVIPFLAGGSYLISIFDRYGCSFEEEVLLEDPPPFVIELGSDLEVELGDQIRIEPISNYPIGNFFWQPEELVDCEGYCWDLEWAPANSMNLILIAISTANCETSDSVFIEVIKTRKVYIPNAFSPNGDGTNDFFVVFGTFPNVQIIEKMIVFNRWGGVVFEQNNFSPNDLMKGWDGTFNGKALNNGVFTYLVEIRFMDGALILYKGDVTLFK